MTKRLYTAEKVLEAVLEDVDDDQDYDDPDEPVMEGSDDEFSDLELDEDDADLDQAPPNSPLTPSVASPLPLPPPLSIASTFTPKLFSTYFTIQFSITTCSVDYNTETSGGEVIQLTSRSNNSHPRDPQRGLRDLLH